MAVKIQLRNDTEANWASENPVLLLGEIGIVTDGANKGFGKVGDGASTWAELQFQIGGGGSTEFRITQASHGLNAGSPIIYSSSAYAGAQADSGANAEVLGGITNADPNGDGDEFVFISAGAVTLTTGEWDAITGGSGGLTAETVYYVDPDAAGLITPTEPSGEGEISRPVYYAVSTTEAYYLPYRGVEIAPSTTSFYQDVTGGASRTVTHNFGHSYVSVTVWDTNASPQAIVIPDDVLINSGDPANAIDVDLSSFGATTFRIVVQDQGSDATQGNTFTSGISVSGGDTSITAGGSGTITLGESGDTIITADGAQVTVADTTGSTSKSTGALVIGGGLGVDENIYSGGTLNAASTLSVSGFHNLSTSNGSVSASGGTHTLQLNTVFPSGILTVHNYRNDNTTVNTSIVYALSGRTGSITVTALHTNNGSVACPFGISISGSDLITITNNYASTCTITIAYFGS